MATQETVRSDKLAEVAGATVDRMAELAREHIELARIQVGTELRLSLERAAWLFAAAASAVIASVLLVAGIFALAGAIIPSVGARLVILAVLVGAASYTLVLKGSARAKSAQTTEPTMPGELH